LVSPIIEVFLESELEGIGRALQPASRPRAVRAGTLLHARHHLPLCHDHDHRQEQAEQEQGDDLQQDQPERVVGEELLHAGHARVARSKRATSSLV
jgi:hypothetical protein